MTESEAEERVDFMKVRYGLDQPMVMQYFNWVKGIVTEGSFGYSFAYSRDVGELIAQRLPRTIALALSAHLVSSVVGLTVGIYVAQRQYSWSDNIAAIIAFTLTALPRFFIALVVIYLIGLPVWATTCQFLLFA